MVRDLGVGEHRQHKIECQTVGCMRAGFGAEACAHLSHDTERDKANDCVKKTSEFNAAKVTADVASQGSRCLASAVSLPQSRSHLTI